MIHILVMQNNIDKFIRLSRTLVSKHKIRSLCIRLLAFQSEHIFMFHQDTCQNGKALKRGTHESFGGESTQLSQVSTHLHWKIKDACKKHKIKIDASNESYSYSSKELVVSSFRG